MQLNHRSYNPPFCPIEATHGSGLYGALIWIFVFLCWSLQTRAFASDLLNLSSQQSCMYQAVIQWRDDKRTSIRPHGGAQTSNPPCTLHAAAVDAPPGARHRPLRWNSHVPLREDDSISVAVVARFSYSADSVWDLSCSPDLKTNKTLSFSCRRFGWLSFFCSLV